MPPEASHREQVAAEAQCIVDNTRHTRYQHPPYRIDDRTGTYNLDCKGFVSLALERIALEHYELVTKAPGHVVPNAGEYYEYFASLSTAASVGWRRLDRLADSRRGDIIAWLLPQSDPAGDSGHVFVVASAPAVIGAGLSAVPAHDASDALHYDDSRLKANGTQETGVGTGTIHFQVDPTTGSPTAFQFGPGDQFHSVPIAIVRLEPLSY